MNFKSTNHPLIHIVLLVLVNGICAMKISNDEESKSVSNSNESTTQNDDKSKYTYNLTAAEITAVEKIDVYDSQKIESTCCTLGRIAALRGFYCNLKFYQKKLLYRVRNRVLRKHIQLVGNGREHIFNRELMIKFGKCLRVPEVFEECCWYQVENSE